jgi:outer membrane protein assembly factor BamD (BamD/ComL family)
MKRLAPFVLLFAFSLVLGCGNVKTEDQLYAEIEKYKSEEKLVEATKAMEQFVEQFNESKHRPALMKELAILYVSSAKDYRKAIDMYKRIQEEYSADTNLVAQCQFMTGYIYANDLKEYDNAQREYEKFLELYPENELADDVQWELKNLGKDLSQIELFPAVDENSSNGKKQSAEK